jgi:periplasmic protein TonB
MYTQALRLDDTYDSKMTVPFAAALAFHIFLLIWDPTILKAGTYQMSAPTINVNVMDHLPVMEPVKPAPKPVEKKVQKKHVKKAKKSGLSMATKAQPLSITRHKVAPKPVAAPKPFVSKIAMPKFVPTESDEPVAASPLPGLAPAASHRAVRSYIQAPKLSGKTRGVRAADIPFQLTERGGLASSADRVVAVPIGEERGDVASLPSAPMIHDAPKGLKGIAGYRYQPGQGSGSGELAGRDKGSAIGYHGIVKADTYVEGSLNGTSGNGKSGKVVAGKGFEIGGPVGDRKISRRRLPEYPAWAEEKGISAMVKVYFTVRPDGSIRTNLRILTSSGYAELDDAAKEALMQWRFSPTSGDSSETAAWGVITFRFTLA